VRELVRHRNRAAILLFEFLCLLALAR